MASVTIPPARSAAPSTPKKRNYSRIIEQTWIWSVVGYSVLRFVIAWGAFSDHGANPWIFGIIDVGTAWPYAKAVALVCKRAASSNWSKLPLPLGLAVVTFFAPYGYLWFGAGEMPSGMRVGMAICVTVLLLAATAGVVSKTRKMRRESHEGHESRESLEQADSVDVLIDLTSGEAQVSRTMVRSKKH